MFTLKYASSSFVIKRKDGLKELQLVETQPNSDPSWFGFMMTLTNEARNEIVEYPNKKSICRKYDKTPNVR